MNRMNPDVKAKWVAALRSGEYRQGIGALRPRKDTFCCLGVLCNLHAREHPDIAAAQTKQNTYMGEDGLLPNEVMYWAGLPSDNPLLPSGKRLAELNDDGVKFRVLADLIERQL